MVKIDILIKEGKVSKIKELEENKYINFFSSSYKDNLLHSKFALKKFPRWSIISAYYSMHDISKLFLAQIFKLKVEFEVHATTIKLLRELIKNKEILSLIEEGYEEFISIANDLAIAKKERVKTQYFTGTKYMQEEYRKKANDFIIHTVKPYIDKIEILISEMEEEK